MSPGQTGWQDHWSLADQLGPNGTQRLLIDEELARQVRNERHYDPALLILSREAHERLLFDVLRAFNLVVCAGKALAVGHGNFWLGQVADSGTVATGVAHAVVDKHRMRCERGAGHGDDEQAEPRTSGILDWEYVEVRERDNVRRHDLADTSNLSVCHRDARCDGGPGP